MLTSPVRVEPERFAAVVAVVAVAALPEKLPSELIDDRSAPFTRKSTRFPVCPTNPLIVAGTVAIAFEFNVVEVLAESVVNDPVLPEIGEFVMDVKLASVPPVMATAVDA